MTSSGCAMIREGGLFSFIVRATFLPFKKVKAYSDECKHDKLFYTLLFAWTFSYFRYLLLSPDKSNFSLKLVIVSCCSLFFIRYVQIVHVSFFSNRIKMSHFNVNKRKVREATLTYSKLSHRQEDRNKLPVWGLLNVSLF